MGMTWNHRVIKSTCEIGASSDLGLNEDVYAIHEVFYDTDAGGIIGWTDEPVAPQGETPEELRRELALMLEACDRPILHMEILLEGLEVPGEASDAR